MVIHVVSSTEICHKISPVKPESIKSKSSPSHISSALAEAVPGIGVSFTIILAVSEYVNPSSSSTLYSQLPALAGVSVYELFVFPVDCQVPLFNRLSQSVIVPVGLCIVIVIVFPKQIICSFCIKPLSPE